MYCLKLLCDCMITLFLNLLKFAVSQGDEDLMSAHMKGLVLATSRGDKFYHVNWPFSLQNLVAGTNFGPCNLSHQFKPA